MRAHRMLRAVPLAASVAVLVAVAPPAASAQSLPATCSTFTDHPIQPQVTVIRAQYFSELRACINDLSDLWSLGASSWSETLVAGQTVIRTVHVQELRTALNAVYAAAAQTAPSYTDTTLTAQTSVVRAIYINELRSFSAAAPLPQVSLAAPTIGPAPGSFGGEVAVTMAAAAGATIRYTTDGSAPTAASAVYSAPLTLTTTTTLRAIAFKPNVDPSPESSAAYTIVVATPTLSLSSGPYDPGTAVGVTSPDAAATMRFTLNGADPTASDPAIASGGTMLVGVFTLKVRAFRAGADDSAVASATFTLSTPLSTGAVSGGDQHTVLASPTGLLYAWGANGSGQLGDGTQDARTVPTLIPSLTGVTKLAAGHLHTLAVTHDGRVFAWGSNGLGRLGDGTTVNRLLPVEITTLSGVVEVAAGQSHSLALTAGGLVYAWGNGGDGRLGQGTTTSLSVPTLVPGLTDVIAIAAGDAHSMAVTRNGHVYVWGLNGGLQLGDGTTTSRLSPLLLSLTDIAAVAAGASHSLALSYTGAVYSWGLGSSGQLGAGNTANRATPATVPNLVASQIAAGGSFSMARRESGTLVAWGANALGQIGNGSTTNRTSPTVVDGPASVATFENGSQHAVAVTPDGDVWTWGAGGSGRLGDGAVSNRPTPQHVFTAGGTWYFQVFDPVAPTITTGYLQPANAAGWHRAAVQLQFACTDLFSAIESCPAAVTVSTEGAGQTVSIFASDEAGNVRTSEAIVNIDLTPPTLSIQSPQPYTTVSGTSVSVTADVSDALSGVASTTCNGVAAAIANGVATCMVPLVRGPNTLLLRATDVAGNTRSRSLVVTTDHQATTLTASPSSYILAIGQTAGVGITDDFGTTPASIAWSTDDPSVATVTNGVVMAISEGEAVITASANGLSTTVGVTVAEGPLPLGTARWSVHPSPGFSLSGWVGVDSVSRTIFAGFETDINGNRQARTFDEEGRQTGLVRIPVPPNASAGGIGDAAGGLLIHVDEGSATSVVRVPLANETGEAWHSPSYPDRVEPMWNTVQCGSMAQGPDGTLFQFAGESVVGIDGLTGEQKFRIWPKLPDYCAPLTVPASFYQTRFLSGITVDAEGRANVLGLIRTWPTHIASPPPWCGSGQTPWYDGSQVVLYRISPDGATIIVPLHEYTQRASYAVNLGIPNGAPGARTLPDDGGGVLAIWGLCFGTSLGEDCHRYARYVSAEGHAGAEYGLPVGTGAGGLLSGSDGVGYYGDDVTPIYSFQMATGGVLNASTVTGAPWTLMSDGTLELFSGGLGLTLNLTTSVTEPLPVAMVTQGVVATRHDSRIVYSSGAIQDKVGPAFTPNQQGYALTGGGLQKRNAAPGVYGIFALAHAVSISTYRHVALRFTPRNQSLWTGYASSPFVNSDSLSKGRAFATLGGGSSLLDGLLCGGLLVGGVNREGDVTLPPYSNKEYERIRYPSVQEDALIARLFTHADNYDNDLPYECFPDPAELEYNSNGYTHGLLDATGLPLPSFPARFGAYDSTPNNYYPGWYKAVPVVHFAND